MTDKQANKWPSQNGHFGHKLNGYFGHKTVISATNNGNFGHHSVDLDSPGPGLRVRV